MSLFDRLERMNDPKAHSSPEIGTGAPALGSAPAPAHLPRTISDMHSAPTMVGGMDDDLAQVQVDSTLPSSISIRR
jgi:hypothetical protein